MEILVWKFKICVDVPTKSVLKLPLKKALGRSRSKRIMKDCLVILIQFGHESQSVLKIFCGSEKTSLPACSLCITEAANVLQSPGTAVWLVKRQCTVL